MKLATFSHDGKTGLGIVGEGGLLDLAKAAPDLPNTMEDFLRLGDKTMDAARKVESEHKNGKHKKTYIPLADVRLDAPLSRPGKFLATGLNYADHLEEARKLPQFKDAERPVHPLWFNKQTTCVNGPFDPILMPRVSDKLDYEAELAVIIGRRCRHVPKERAAEVIAGFTIVNDVSVRDWQAHSGTMTMGKSFDTHGPLGPWIVTPDEVGDPHDLGIRARVNGELRQESNTRHMFFNCYEQIAYLTTAFTLEPGDIISTGTPAGVGIGFSPPRFLAVGDVVRIEIDKIGHIEATVTPEPEATAVL